MMLIARIRRPKLCASSREAIGHDDDPHPQGRVRPAAQSRVPRPDGLGSLSLVREHEEADERVVQRVPREPDGIRLGLSLIPSASAASTFRGSVRI